MSQEASTSPLVDPGASPETATPVQPTVAPTGLATVKFTQEGKEFLVAPGANLRQKAIEQDIDLYTLKGKLMNCGGYGQCGTCVVNVLEGGEHLSPRTDFENRKLKRKPENFRLACQALVNGSVTVQTKP